MAKISFIVLTFSICLLVAVACQTTTAVAPPTVPAPTESPTYASVATQPPPIEQPTLSIQEQLNQIDKKLAQAINASIAFNTPNTMLLNETTTINLLINPSLSPQQLGTQVTGSGPVISATIKVTPYMRAILTAADPDAIIVQPLQDIPDQPISGTETTKWSWVVTAKKAGLQTLTLTIYRLVQLQGQDYWRQVDTYQKQIKINVTFSQWVTSLDWKWFAGFSLALVGAVVGVLTYLNNRNKKN